MAGIEPRPFCTGRIEPDLFCAKSRYQDYFDTTDRLMIADVPVKGIRTIYGAVGDWFIALVWAGLAAVVVLTVRDLDRRRKG